SYMNEWLDLEKTPYWACRYAALQAFEPFINARNWDRHAVKITNLKDDPQRFVLIKAKRLEKKHLNSTGLAN
ncbi:MAG: bilin biosynthesis protein CpeY, partial [Prochlorococcus sp.]